MYGDNKEIISDCIPEIQSYMDDILPTEESEKALETELLDIVVNIEDFLK